MTAEEILDKTFDKHKWRMVSPPYYESEEAVLDAMQEFARLKCQELLEIVAEKAKVKVSQHCFELSEEVDKDSILNAVDLNSFIQ